MSDDVRTTTVSKLFALTVNSYQQQQLSSSPAKFFDSICKKCLFTIMYKQIVNLFEQINNLFKQFANLFKQICSKILVVCTNCTNCYFVIANAYSCLSKLLISNWTNNNLQIVIYMYKQINSLFKQIIICLNKLAICTNCYFVWTN